MQTEATPSRDNSNRGQCGGGEGERCPRRYRTRAIAAGEGQSGALQLEREVLTLGRLVDRDREFLSLVKLF